MKSQVKTFVFGTFVLCALAVASTLGVCSNNPNPGSLGGAPSVPIHRPTKPGDPAPAAHPTSKTCDEAAAKPAAKRTAPTDSDVLSLRDDMQDKGLSLTLDSQKKNSQLNFGGGCVPLCNPFIEDCSRCNKNVCTCN